MDQPSNYEKVFDHYRKLFLHSDHEKAAAKLLLQIDGENLIVPFFCRPVILNRKTGDMRWQNGGGEMPVSDRLVILHHLHFYREDAALAGKMVAFREVRGLMHFEPAYQNLALKPLAKAFSGDVKGFAERAAAIGGKKESYGDASFTIQAFPTIPLTYIFWDWDEEFPASATILYDKNITQFIHPESVPALACAGVTLLIGQERATFYNI